MLEKIRKHYKTAKPAAARTFARSKMKQQITARVKAAAFSDDEVFKYLGATRASSKSFLN